MRVTDEPVELVLIYPEITQFRKERGVGHTRAVNGCVITVADRDFSWKIFLFPQMEELFENLYLQNIANYKG